MKIFRYIGYVTVLALIAGGIYIYFKASNLKDPEFVRMDNIRFKNITAPPNLKLTFVSDAILNNPNPYSLTIAKVEFDVYVDGKKTTHFVQDVESEMAANSEFKLPLSFEVPITKKEFLKNLKDMIGGAWKKASLKIRSKGDITIRATRVTFDIPFDYEDEYRLEDYL